MPNNNWEIVTAIATSIYAIPIIIRFAKKLPERWRSRNLMSIQEGSSLMQDTREKYTLSIKMNSLEPGNQIYVNDNNDNFNKSRTSEKNRYICVLFCLSKNINIFGKSGGDENYKKIKHKDIPVSSSTNIWSDYYDLRFNESHTKIYKIHKNSTNTNENEKDVIWQHIKIDKKLFKRAIKQFKQQSLNINVNLEY
jgi:hypothetical protein